MQAKQNWDNPNAIRTVRESVYICFQKQEKTCSLFVSFVLFFKRGLKKREKPGFWVNLLQELVNRITLFSLTLAIRLPPVSSLFILAKYW